MLQVQPKKSRNNRTEPQEIDVLFLEVDGLYTSLQQADKDRHEIKVGVAHEGWKKRHPQSKEYTLVNKSYSHTLEDDTAFWDTFSRALYEQYAITDKTPVVINGDGAPWIREGIHYFPCAIYTYNRYHLKKWIKEALNHRSKQEQKRAYEAVDAGDPSALAAAIAEAEGAETDAKKRDEIKALREFILNNREALRDYRERLREKGIDTTGMRPMGA